MKGITNTTWVILVLLSVILILGLSNWNVQTKLNRSQNEASNYKFSYTLYKDSLRATHASYEAKMRTLGSLSPQDGVVVDNIAKDLHIKTKDVKSVTTISTQTRAPIYIRDTIFSDGHLSINTTKTDSGLIGSYKYVDTATLVTYKKYNTFLGIRYAPKVMGDIHYNNPNTTITGLNSINISDYVRPLHWTLGPSIEWTYYNGKFMPFVGVSLQYSLIRF